MTAHPDIATDQRSRSRRPAPTAARLASSAVFLSNGMILSSWVPLIPLAKERLALSEAVLGIVLLALGAGALLVMPFAGLLITRFGSRNAILVASMIFFLMLPLLAWAPAIPMLVVCLFIFGAANGVMDISMNAQGVAVEHLAGRPIFSSLHAMFSIGGMIGAVICGGLMHLGLDAVSAAALISGAMALMIFSQFRFMLPGGAGKGGGKHYGWPPLIVVLLGLLAFAAMMAEGAMMDWSAVFLRFERGFTESAAGLGFAAFSVTMALGRLTGDWVVTKIGPVATIRYGSAIAAAGLLIAMAVNQGYIGLAGFALAGIGLANAVPQIFSMAGRLPGLSPGIAISAVAIFAYAGVLAGPPLIGPLAQLTSLPIALSLVAGGLILVSLWAGIAAPAGGRSGG
jgi:predicted MFS family arabinose efflux permease